ncbi:hypothetical protein [Peptoniphilus sp. EMRHCC_23]|uniref:hypothetical protein n=1 Tax=Peptoniphilus rachelemmaiella TaxID=2811779 RepID=UPI001C00897A|nr:hypothetical protein [Peptoniphilus rachelemmaiella]
MKKTTMEIYKAMFPSLLIYLLIVAGFTQIFNMMGLGTDAFMTPGANPAMPMPEFHFGAMAGVSLLVHTIYLIAVGLVGYGLILMIYRMARYDTTPEFVDAFYFFNPKLVSSIGTYIIEKILTVVFFFLLIVPAIIFSLAMVPLGAVIGIDGIRGREGAFTPIRESWQITKGHKGMIFGRMAIVVIIVLVFSGGIGLAAAASGMTQGALMKVMNVVSTVIFGLISYVAVVDVIRELVARGAFDAIDPIHEDIEDDMEGEVL